MFRNEKGEIESKDRKLKSLVNSTALQTVTMSDFEAYVQTFLQIVKKNELRQRQLPLIEAKSKEKEVPKEIPREALKPMTPQKSDGDKESVKPTEVQQLGLQSSSLA